MLDLRDQPTAARDGRYALRRTLGRDTSNVRQRVAAGRNPRRVNQEEYEKH